MLRHLRLFLIAGMILSLADACSTAPQLVTPNEVFDFGSDQERQQFEKLARAGDTKAANRLANYYVFIRNDKQKAIHWLKIAAAHGDDTAKQNIRTLREE